MYPLSHFNRRVRKGNTTQRTQRLLLLCDLCEILCALCGKKNLISKAQQQYAVAVCDATMMHKEQLPVTKKNAKFLYCCIDKMFLLKQFNHSTIIN